jgi:hypothetical protein
MAYGNNQGANQQRGNSYGNRPAQGAPVAAGVKKEFTDDPGEVGIGYSKELKAGGSFIAFTVTKDIKAGTKVAIFNNDKVKNRTDKTPTHKMKLSVKKPA